MSKLERRIDSFIHSFLELIVLVFSQRFRTCSTLSVVIAPNSISNFRPMILPLRQECTINSAKVKLKENKNNNANANAP